MYTFLRVLLIIFVFIPTIYYVFSDPGGRLLILFLD